MFEVAQYLSALGLSALEAVSEKGAPLLAFALLDLPLLWQLLSLLPCLRFPALWIELLGLLVRSLAQWLLQAGASGVFAGDSVVRSAHSRSGVLPLRRSAEQGLFCWRLGSSGLLQHGICRSRLLFGSASFGTGVSALSASLASFLRHFALLLFCFCLFFHGGVGALGCGGARQTGRSR